MKKITFQDAQLMITGASILSCGGGLSYDEQLKYIQTLPFQDVIHVLGIDSIDKFDNNSVFVTASEIGPADKPPIDKTKIPQMIQLFVKKSGRQIAGIIPVEIGQESIVFDTALRSTLPIVDSDLAGLRAVPKTSMNALIMQNVSFTRSPLVVLTHTGEIIFINKNNSLEEDEKQLRAIAKETDNVIFAMGGFITPSKIKKYLNHNSLTTIYNIGHSIEKHGNFINKIPLPLVFSGTGQIQQIVTINTSGFFEKEVLITIDKHQDKTFKLTIVNEYMKLTNQQKTFQFPQLITLFSKQLNRGLSSSELTIGMQVQIYVFNPLTYWSSYHLN